MSGFEAAGIALAILPLIFNAAQSYENVVNPFLRYKQFSRQARIYSKELSIQRTIFRNECRNLLEEVIDHDAASVMLNSLTPEIWGNDQVDAQLVQHLSDSKTACIDIIDLIKSRLQDIESENRQFTATLEEEHEAIPKALRNRKWRQSVGTKLGFGFSKSRLERNIAALRSYNDDLVTLSTQTTHQKLPHKTLKGSSGARNTLHRYQTIGEASQHVYQALEHACTKHTEHVAHFPIEAEGLVPNGNLAPQVKFIMAFTHMNLAGASTMGDRFWFVVDTIINQQLSTASNDQINSLDIMGTTLRSQLESTLECPSRKAKKSVRFQSPAPVLAPIPLDMADDFFSPRDSMRTDFCDKLRRHFREPRSANTCIGLLGSTAECKHYVYPSPFTNNSQSRRAFSLGDLMRSSSNPGLAAGIPVHERVSLARQLTIAVLQYHATPWLKASWRSDDIFFFDNSESFQACELRNFGAPYINAIIKGTNEHSTNNPRNSSKLARNPRLFSLGVVLLEIAHGASLNSFQRPSDLIDGEKYADFFTARRLAKSNFTVMGLQFHQITEQLLECAFPFGDDLGNARLQAAIHEGVVCPLEELEQNLRGLYLTE